MAAPDSSFSNVSLLLPFDGPDGGTTFADKSSAPKTLVANGGAALSTAKSKFGGASLRLDGNGGFLAAPPSADFAFGAGDFCKEGWLYLDAYPSSEGILFCLRNAAAGIFDNMTRLSSAGRVGWSDGMAWRESSATVPLNQWVHIAIARASGVLRIFINGVQSYEGSHPIDLAGSRVVQIGAYEAYSSNAAGGFFNGYLDDLRITKGGARYTAAFTPPTEAHPTDAVALYSGASSPLGDAQAYALVFGGTVESRASAPSPLGDPAAYAKLSVLAQASGFAVGAFGSPTGFNVQRASGFSPTVFGTPVSPYPRAVAAEGFGTVQIGRPMAFATTEVQINRLVTATPIHGTGFGQASYSGQITAQASGHQTGAFGAPKAMQALVAQTLGAVPSFGIPALRTGLQAAGFQGTGFGVPRAGRGQSAASIYRPTRWGVPSSSRSDTYLAQPAARGARFGRPAGWSLHAYQASPVPTTTTFGAALCQQRHRAASTYSGARFGKPLLLRSTAC